MPDDRVPFPAVYNPCEQQVQKCECIVSYPDGMEHKEGISEIPSKLVGGRCTTYNSLTRTGFGVNVLLHWSHAKRSPDDLCKPADSSQKPLSWFVGLSHPVKMGKQQHLPSHWFERSWTPLFSAWAYVFQEADKDSGRSMIAFCQVLTAEEFYVL